VRPSGTGPAVRAPLDDLGVARRGTATPPALLRQIAMLLARRVDPDVLFETMAEGLREFRVADRASLAMYDEERDEFEIVALALHEDSRHGKGWTIPHRNSQVGRGFDSGEPFVTVHCAGPVLFEDRPLAEEGMRHAVVVPMTHEGKRIGTFNTDLRTIRDRTGEEMECLVAVAGQIAAAVATANTFCARALRTPQPACEPAGFDIPDTSEAAKTLVANCPSFHARIGALRSMAETDATVLITGETGTGKGVVARALHAWSGRRQGPFVKCDCAALATGVIDSELFGHERGAFTGADRRRTGRFEAAHGGTILLDEIGELPLDVQGKLLGVLQDRECLRVGGTTPVKLDVRVLAATNRDLRADVASGRFRADLFYRLNVLQLHLPPLRERPEDILPLAEHFVRARSHGIEGLRDVLHPGELEALAAYSWPGNVRELETMIERAMVLGEKFVFEPDWDCRVRTPELVTGAGLEDGLMSLAEAETRHIAKVLRATGGRIAGPNGAARILGLHPNTLRSLMIRLNFHQRSDI
jgi:formate hydrogenlyase transcriptional activator